MRIQVVATEVALGLLVAVVIVVSVAVASAPYLTVGPVWVWGPSLRVTTERLFELTPRSDAMLLDEELYLGTLDGMRRGEGFYQAQNDMFNVNPGRWDTRSPLSYRQPLLTYVWLVLRSGSVIGIFWGVLAVASMIAAFRMAATLVRPELALVAPAALCAIYSLMLRHPIRILYAETWAAPMVVTAGALCGLVLVEVERASGATRRSWVLSALGAASALSALLLRELSLAAISFMVLALLLDAEARQRRLWLPWIAGLGVWLAQYLIHIIQVLAVSQGDPPSPTMPSYLHPRSSILVGVRTVG